MVQSRVGTMNGLQFAPHLRLVLREAATEHDFICIPLKVESESILETATAQHQHTEQIKIMFMHVLVTSDCRKLFAARKSMKLCIIPKAQGMVNGLQFTNYTHNHLTNSTTWS